MCELVARTGRHQQRYQDGSRLVAGCIPFKYTSDEACGDSPKKIIEVLMINSQSGPGLLFPKGGWENDETVEEAAVREAIEEAGVRGDLMEFLGHYDFKSKSHQDEFSPDGLCKAAMFALHVNEEMESWPEQSTRERKWLAITEASEQCRHPWMREALSKFLEYHNVSDVDVNGISAVEDENGISAVEDENGTSAAEDENGISAAEDENGTSAAEDENGTSAAEDDR